MFTLQNLSSTGNFYITQVNIPQPSDVYFKYVTMLLHGDGTNGSQNNTFIDSSTNAFTITRNGNTTQGTFSPYDASWSNYFNGSSTYFTVPTNANLHLETASVFTVEAWIYLTGIGSSQSTIVGNRSGLSVSGWEFRVSTSRTLQFYYTGNSGSTTNSTDVLAYNTWYHVALVRNSGTVQIFINGALSITNNSITNGTLNSTALTIGAEGSDTTSIFAGYISNLRIVNGTALYTAAFTVPTSPLTAITNTALLTCQSNQFIDNSTNAFTITTTGLPIVQSFSPFAPTTAYSTSVIGGSAYFDGTGDYLSIPNAAALQFGTGDFTAEYWVYFNSTPSGTSQMPLSKWASNTGWELYFTSNTNKFAFYALAGTPAILGTTSPVGGVWYHLAVSRASGTIRLFVNGTQEGSSVTGNTSDFSDTNTLFIGKENNTTGLPFTGYVSNLRIVKGTAVYTANFTPPTAPLTAIANTSLLCNFTNAAVVDNSQLNNLETVGTVQINTSVAKFGAGSMYFDGSSYLTGKSSTNFSFTGDFTIECWVYLTTASGTKTIFTNRSSYANPTGLAWVTQSGSAALSIYTNSGFSAASSTAITTNTWTHVALTRSGSTITQWLNGVSVANVTNSSSFTDALCYIGANNSAAEYWPGYIDDFRITNGIARYSNTFTVPTTVFPDIGP